MEHGFDSRRRYSTFKDRKRTEKFSSCFFMPPAPSFQPGRSTSVAKPVAASPYDATAIPMRRIPRLYSAASTRVLAAEYADALRTTRRRIAPPRPRLSPCPPLPCRSLADGQAKRAGPANGLSPAILPFFKKPLGLCWAVTGVFRIFACQMEDSHDKTRKTG